jgi:hypothetical protein
MGERLMPLSSGRATVPANATAMPLSATDVEFESVTITALATNTKVVCVGGPDVVAAAATRKGTPLEKGQTVRLSKELDGVSDLAHVFVDAEVNGEGVTFSYGHHD